MGTGSLALFHVSRVRERKDVGGTRGDAPFAFFSQTPFPYGVNDPPQKILRRIGEGKFSMGGNWKALSSPAQVRLFFRDF